MIPFIISEYIRIYQKIYIRVFLYSIYKWFLWQLNNKYDNNISLLYYNSDIYYNKNKKDYNKYNNEVCQKEQFKRMNFNINSIV